MAEAKHTHAELMTLVFEEYKKSHDLEVALDYIPMSAEERHALEADLLLAEMVKQAEAEERSIIMQHLRTLAMTAESEGVQLSALEKYGRMIHPKKFKPDQIDVNVHDYRVIGRKKAS